MHVLTQTAADLRSRHCQMAIALLSALLCICAPAAKAGTDQVENAHRPLERLAFTGTYRFQKSSTGSSRPQSDPTTRAITAVAPPSLDSSHDHTGPDTPSEVPPITQTDASHSSKSLAAVPATVINASRKINDAPINGSAIKTSSLAQPTRQQDTASKVAWPSGASSQTVMPHLGRSSLGAAPANALKTPAGAPADTQQERPPLTRRSNGQITGVPPLPDLYRRPNRQFGKLIDKPARRWRRAAKRVSRSQRKVSAQSKPTWAGYELADWANKALFESD